VDGRRGRHRARLGSRFRTWNRRRSRRCLTSAASARCRRPTESVTLVGYWWLGVTARASTVDRSGPGTSPAPSTGWGTSSAPVAAAMCHTQVRVPGVLHPDPLPRPEQRGADQRLRVL
jgi:hypothetical protein